MEQIQMTIEIPLEEYNAMKKLIEDYRDYICYPDEHRSCVTYSYKLNNCNICEAEEEYEKVNNQRQNTTGISSTKQDS